MNQPEFQIVSDHFAVWYAFDPSVKADLFSTAVSTEEGTIVIDPIVLGSSDLSRLHAKAPIAAIIVTSQNHWRASEQLARQFSVPILAHAAAQLENVSAAFVPVVDGERLESGLEIMAIEGAAPGEITIFSELDGGSLFIGDALINVDPYGFTFLPPQYCADHRAMRRSLRRLANRQVKRIFFAHGLPITTAATSRLCTLLNQE